MAFWNFCHETLHMHVYLLPSIAVALGMVVSGALHRKKMNEREKEFEKALAKEEKA